MEKRVVHLFLDYVRTLNTEFKSYNDDSMEEAQQKCIRIAEELESLDFIIRAQHVSALQKKLLSDDTMQSIITIRHFVALIKKDRSAILMEATAESKILGAPFAVDLYPINPQDATWLNSVLNFLITDKSDNNTSQERN